MLCSAIELGLGDDADGIHLLGHGDELPLGQPVGRDRRRGRARRRRQAEPRRRPVDGGPGPRGRRLHRRGRCACRDASVAEDRDEPTDEHVSVASRTPTLNPRFAARWFDDVANGPSPDWMQRRLLAAGMRPISAVVDVTNYVMHELGQPMHAYDADAIPDGEIVVRRARAGEPLETIDHVERELDERMLVIADRERAIGLAGIMGGAGDRGHARRPRRVILESAIFHGPTHPQHGAAAGPALGGEHAPREGDRRTTCRAIAADRAARLHGRDHRRACRRAASSTTTRSRSDADAGGGERRAPRAPARHRADAGARSRSCCGRSGFAVSGDGDALEVTVPDRTGSTWSLEADVAEEVARAHGYERIPGACPRPQLPPYRPDPSEPRHRVRRILAGLGLDEVVRPRPDRRRRPRAHRATTAPIRRSSGSPTR